MEDPVAEIPHVIRTLCQTAPSRQRATIEKYFTPSAAFIHPICRTGSFNGSRWLIWCIYRWYKIISPRIEMGIDSVAYDRQNLILYVSIHQFLRLWILPFITAHSSLVTVLYLVPDRPDLPGHHKESTPIKYLIKTQSDHYQPDQLARYFSPFGILYALILVSQLLATTLCVLGAAVGWPVTWVEENVLGGNQDRSLEDVIKG